MNRKDMKERFENEFKKYEEDEYVNPLEVFENHYFGSKMSTDYRKDAIDRCVKERLNFSSTSNNIVNLVKMYFTPKCPICNKEMKGSGAGGNGVVMGIDFKCECGSKITITVPHNAIEVNLKYSK